MSFDDADRALLLDILTVTRENRDATVRCADQLRTLNEIVAREVSPLGQFRADVIDKLEEHYNRVGRIGLDVAELTEWRDEHDKRYHPTNGGE